MGLRCPSVGLQWCHQSQLPCVDQTPLGQASLHARKHQPNNKIPKITTQWNNIVKAIITVNTGQERKPPMASLHRMLTSMYFLALSHAPPVLEAEIAIC